MEEKSRSVPKESTLLMSFLIEILWVVDINMPLVDFQMIP
jgi:hypothetical protein